MWIFALFIAVPLIEIALFIQVGGLIGLWPTLGLVLLTAVAGTTLMRSQGARAWMEVQRSFAELRDPTGPMAHGAMILFAGALLLTPGFFTDTTGILLLIPAVRAWAIRALGRRVTMTRIHPQGHARREPHRPPFNDGVIDAEYVVEPDAPRPTAPDGRPASGGAARPDTVGTRTGPTTGRPSGWTRH